MYTELKETNLETILRSLDFGEEEISRIRSDIGYYDRYILVQEGLNIGILTVLRQPFGDSYLDLTLDECDLLNYRGEVSIESFLDVMDDVFEIPQVARCYESDKEDFKKRGFRDIKEKEPKHANASRLIPVKFEIRGLPTIPIPQYVRLMSDKDIPHLINLFAEEYPARSRAVKRMYEADPTSCFVYEEKRVIKGVIFGEQIPDSNILVIHQMLVKRSEWGKRIDRALLGCIINYAVKNNLDTIQGTIRGNLLPYYRRLGAIRDRSIEDQRYLVRFEI